ncbi:hypothetical protein FKM82_007527 [Ascaphus truei]
MRVRERGPQCVPFSSTMLCPLLLLLKLGVSGVYSENWASIHQGKTPVVQ